MYKLSKFSQNIIKRATIISNIPSQVSYTSEVCDTVISDYNDGQSDTVISDYNDGQSDTVISEYNDGQLDNVISDYMMVT